MAETLVMDRHDETLVDDAGVSVADLLDGAGGMDGQLELEVTEKQRAPDDGIYEFADGLVVELRTSETHKIDSSALDRRVSRVTGLLQRRFGRAAAIGLMLLPPATAMAACGGTSGHGQTPSNGPVPTPTADAPGQGGGETINGAPTCFVKYEQLGAVAQENCRADFAELSDDQVTHLNPLNQARWAGYFAYKKLDAGTIVPAYLYFSANQLNTKDGANVLQQSADVIFGGYRENIYRLAYLMQTKPDVANDPRTIRALCGPEVTEESIAYRDAKKVADTVPAGGKTADEYIKGLMSGNLLFNGIATDNVQRQEGKGGSVTISFTAKRSDGQPQTFTYTFYEYFTVQQDASGKQREVAFDDRDPIFAALGRPMLGSLRDMKVGGQEG